MDSKSRKQTTNFKRTKEISVRYYMKMKFKLSEIIAKKQF